MQTSNRSMVVDDDNVTNCICKYEIGKLFNKAEIKLYTKPAKALEANKKEYGKAGTNISRFFLLEVNLPSILFRHA